MKEIKFLHTADLHLDSPLVGLRNMPQEIYNQLLDSTFIALKTLIDTAINKQVDFVIIAGDVYDGEDRSIRAQVRFKNEMERLKVVGIPVFLVHGNHDHLSGSWTQLALPENVRVFGDCVECKVFNKLDTIVHLYGFSYPKRHVHERIIEDYQKLDGADFHIGILHGNEGGESGHQNYAPFSVEDLLEKQFHYWALGHIHKSRILGQNPTILYPGNIQGRHHKEQGSKGCYIVTLTERETLLEWIETAEVLWETLEVDLNSCTNFNEVYQLLEVKIDGARCSETKGKIVNLVVNNLSISEGVDSILNGELLEVLQDGEKDRKNFVWVSSININEITSFDKDRLRREDGFFGELFNTITNFDDVEASISALYRHQHARRHIDRLADEAENELVQKAERIILQLLHGSNK